MGGMSRALPVLLCLMVLACLPAVAGAKGPPREPDEGPDPRGLTLSGIGLAEVRVSGRPTEASIEHAIAAARPAALGRAVRRARARAAALAAAGGLTLGPAVVVTERDQGFEQGFVGGGARYCTRARRGAQRGRLRCRAPRVTSATVSVTFATAQTSAALPTGRALVLPGVASAPVLPEDRRSSPSILRALLAAQDAATPAALATGRRAIRATAAAAGFPAGALVAIAEVRRPFEDFAAGSFGPGRFCGLVRNRVARRDPRTGRRVLRTVRRRSCFFSRELSVGLRLTYAS
jgi:uncharacterized protein DUF541